MPQVSSVLSAAIEAGRVQLNRSTEGAVNKAYCACSEEEFVELCHQLSTLEELTCLPGMNLTDSGCVALPKLTKLRILNINDTVVTGNGLEWLARLPNLEELCCNPYDHVPVAAAAIAQCRALRRLDLSGALFTDDDVRIAISAPQLEYLSLESNKYLSDEGLVCVSSLARLKQLILSATNIGDRGCQFIGKCESLLALGLAETGVSDVGIRQLSRLRELEYVTLGMTRITVDGIRMIAKLPRLAFLSIPANGLGDEIIAPILACETLHSLDWRKNPLSQAALQKLLHSRQWKLFTPTP